MARAADKLTIVLLSAAICALLWKLYRKDAKQAKPDAPSSEWINRIDKQNESKWNDLQENKSAKNAAIRLERKA